MTKEELIKKLKEECNTDDPEMDHIKADRLLLEFIDDELVTEAFKNIEMWYAQIVREE